MPILTIEGHGPVTVTAGTRLVNAIEDAGVDILHRCGGHAKCTTCRVDFLDGEPDQMTQAVSYRDLFHLAADLRAMGEGNALALRPRRFARHDVVLRAAEILAGTAADPQEPGRVRVGFDLVALTGWAPVAALW